MNLKNILISSSIAINIVLAIALFKGCNSTPCPQAGTTVKEWADTIHADINKVKPDVTVQVPQPRQIFHKLTSATHPSVGSVNPATSTNGTASQATGVQLEVACGDMLIYGDTICRDDNYEAYIYDTVQNNRITGRGIWFFNLTPQIIQHKESTIVTRENLHLYVGAFAGFNKPYTGTSWNWSVGPELMLTEPHGIAISYGFDAKNNGHFVSLLYKIKLKQ